MLGFICCFMPSFISLGIYNKMNSNEKINKMVIFYGMYCAINNFLTLLLFFILNFRKNTIIDFNVLQYDFKYLCCAIFFSIISPYIIKSIMLNIKIKVEVKKLEKKNN